MTKLQRPALTSHHTRPMLNGVPGLCGGVHFVSGVLSIKPFRPCAAVWMICVGWGLTGCGRPPIPQTTDIQVSPGTAAITSGLPNPQFRSGDWPGWRGPYHDGISTESVPTEWSESHNVVWKSKLPGRGHASPVVVGDQIFLATADDRAQTQSVLAVDRRTGKWRWQTEILEGAFESELHAENSHASSTIACDGTRLFVTFLNDRRIWCSALSLEGEELWRQDVGGFRSKFGYSASPLVYQSLVILAADHADGGFIAALDRGTGNIVWRRRRPAAASYASPRVVTLGGIEQVVICGCDQVMSYNPQTGAELWSVQGTTEATVGTPVVSGELVIVSGGYPGAETVALDGTGKVAWRVREKCYVPSLLATDGFLYLMQDDGIARCLEAATGKERWKHRVGGKFRASPTRIGDYIYATDMAGRTVVYRVNPDKFELVSESTLGTEGFASPAVSQGQLFLRIGDDSRGRREEFLYCIGQTAPPARDGVRP